MFFLSNCEGISRNTAQRDRKPRDNSLKLAPQFTLRSRFRLVKLTAAQRACYSLLRLRGERSMPSPATRLPVNFSGSRNITEQPKHCQNSVWYQSPLRLRTRTWTYFAQGRISLACGGSTCRGTYRLEPFFGEYELALTWIQESTSCHKRRLGHVVIRIIHARRKGLSPLKHANHRLELPGLAESF